ncbi:hypothetical protein CYMTET_55063 [Cymbomonas tetramitiformis]|uniref:Uncharacterized protein n=1 Tax=Cymbomonas tetramitiformis TaxID=36881 RepID=A0AAE0BDQ6_9CHLO|nr:hypothetical protein CYMTET_55063 [Cymbomonas tetramitiformis]
MREAFPKDFAGQLLAMTDMCVRLEHANRLFVDARCAAWKEALDHLTSRDQPVFLCLVEAYPVLPSDRVRFITQLAMLLK